MRHPFVKAPRIGEWLRDFGVEDAGARKQYNSTDHPSEPHELSEQELDLLAELVAISADYSETRDLNGALTAFYPVTGITGAK